MESIRKNEHKKRKEHDDKIKWNKYLKDNVMKVRKWKNERRKGRLKKKILTVKLIWINKMCGGEARIVRDCKEA